jgi:hypothetical protein
MPYFTSEGHGGACSGGEQKVSPGCAALTRALGGEPAGTAGHMSSWLLVEQSGSWGPDALEDVVAQAFPGRRLEDIKRAGLRPLLIREPGRHARVPGARRAVYVGSGRPGHRWLERFEIGELSELASLDLDAIAAGKPGHGAPVDGPLFLVCTHGSKDMCCAVFGRPVASGLARTYPGHVWEVSHVGGDRWAGNLVTVPDGFLHGGLTAAEAAVAAKEAMNGQVCLEHLRGRTSVRSPWAQFAEITVRRHTGLRGLDAVQAVEEHDYADSRTVLVSAGEQLYEVVLRREPATTAGENRCSGNLVLAGYVADSVRAVRQPQHS